MTTYDTLPEMTGLIFGRGNDKIISAGPFTIGGNVQPNTRRLRLVIKPLATTDDAAATLDKNSVDHPAIVTPTGSAAAGMYVLDIRENLPPVGLYHMRLDMSDANGTSNVETVGLASLEVRAV